MAVNLREISCPIPKGLPKYHEPIEINEDMEDNCDRDDEGWGFLDRACRWFNSRKFQGQIDDFTRMHAHEFEDAFEAGEKAGEHIHRFRYSDLHAQYLALIETLFIDFLEKEARSAEELFSDMKDANENNYTPLFEEHRHHGFVQNLLAAMEYEGFCRLMIAAAARHGNTRGEGKHRNTSTK